MKVKIELFGAARDFSEQNLLELDLEQKSTIKACVFYVSAACLHVH